MSRKKKLSSVDLKEKFNEFLKDIDVLENLNHIETESTFFDILNIMGFINNNITNKYKKIIELKCDTYDSLYDRGRSRGS